MVNFVRGIKLATVTTLLSLALVIVLLLITAGILGLVVNSKFNQFLKAAGVSRSEFVQMVKTGLNQPVTQTNDHKNVLLLGVDTLKTRGNSLPLTDTMMLVSINTKTGTVNTLPLPRDLWSDQYSTKINALYSYGFQRFPDDPARFPKETLETMTGVPIHHTVVLTMDEVSTIIDTLGGVEIDVKEGFTDPEFPRPDVDVTTEHDPKKLYESVTFDPGKQVMSGQRALIYIRSRHSSGDEGTDIARAKRQQQVIAALVNTFHKKSTLLNPVLMGQLYRYYLDTFAKSFSPQEGIATAKLLFPYRNSLTINSHTVPIYPDDPQGIIEHPPTTPKKYQNQWVYTVRDPAQFAQAVQKILYGN